MKTISSAEFRKTYPRLEESVLVTANGHVIGEWHPESTILRFSDAPELLDVTDRSRPRRVQRPMTQAERDAILRKINKGG